MLRKKYETKNIILSSLTSLLHNVSEPEHVKLQFPNVGTTVYGSLLRPSQTVKFSGCGWFVLAVLCKIELSVF